MDRETLETYGLAALGAAEGILKYYVSPELTAKRTWLAIGALVAIHEISCPPGELLSEGADRAIEKHPFLVPALGMVLAGHVLNAFPEKADPVHQGFLLLRRMF